MGEGELTFPRDAPLYCRVVSPETTSIQTTKTDTAGCCVFICVFTYINLCLYQYNLKKQAINLRVEEGTQAELEEKDLRGVGGRKVLGELM